MRTPVDFLPDDESRIVYVRKVRVDELPPELRNQAGPREAVYAVHTADGAPWALVQNRRQAMRLAREHEMTPVSVH